MQTIRKRFKVQVTAESQTITEKFEIEKTAKKILGIVITSDREDFLYYRGVQKIELNGTEIFPDDYESKLLMVSVNVPPNDRYYKLDGVELGNGVIKFIYKDSPHASTCFSPYTVNLYVEYGV